MTRRGPSADHALSSDQIRQLLASCQTLEEGVLVKLPIYTGMRSGEIAHLRASWITSEGHLKIPREQPCACWECGNSPHQGYWIPKTKAGARTLPIAQQLYPDLMAFLHKSPDGFGLSRVNVYHHIKLILRRAGLPWAYPHSLRATCATMLATGGMSASGLSYFMGWASVSVGDAYIQLSQAQNLALSEAKRIFG